MHHLNSARIFDGRLTHDDSTAQKTFVVAQLQTLTIDEDLLNETSLRVSRTIKDKGDTLRKELSLQNESLVNLERAIDAISIPTGDDAREVKRLDSLASLTEQQTRDLRRRNDLQ